MIRRGWLLALGLVVLLAAGWFSAAGAEAASPARPCASRAEAAALRHGMVPSEVERIVGFKGTRSRVYQGDPVYMPHDWFNAEYRSCGGKHPLFIRFEDRDGWWRLADKMSPWHGPGFGD